jgi:hypothetical protein
MLETRCSGEITIVIGPKRERKVSVVKMEDVLDTLELRVMRVPRVLLVDLGEDAKQTLSDRGFNVSDASFGHPFRGQRAPGFVQSPFTGSITMDVAEPDVVIVDLQVPVETSTPKEDQFAPQGAKAWWTSAETGVVDPRPPVMLQMSGIFDTVFAHGSATWAKGRRAPRRTMASTRKGE